MPVVKPTALLPLQTIHILKNPCSVRLALKNPTLKPALKPALLLALAFLGNVTTAIAHAETLYQATTPDGRTVTVNNVTEAYQINPDTSKIKALDTPVNTAPATTTPAYSPPPVTPTEAQTTYSTTSVNNGDTTSTTTTVNQPLITEPTTPPPMSEFDELNISSTRASKKGDYKLTLVTPTAETPYRKPAQAIDVTLNVRPALKKGDTINIAIDGHVIKNGTDLTYHIPTIDLNPDKHTLTVSVINVLNQPIATAEASIYIIQNNPLIRKQRQLAKQLAAYEALPWYEKLKLRLGFEDKPDTTVSTNPSAQ